MKFGFADPLIRGDNRKSPLNWWKADGDVCIVFMRECYTDRLLTYSDVINMLIGCPSHGGSPLQASHFRPYKDIIQGLWDLSRHFITTFHLARIVLVLSLGFQRFVAASNPENKQDNPLDVGN